MESAQPITAETLFQQSIEEALARAQSLPNIDLVVGIPFYSEKNILPDLIRIVDNALGDIHADGQALILSVGDPAAGDWLSSITGLELKLLHDAFLMQPGCNGRGASIRAIMEIADYLKADVMILAADINESDGNKLHPGWIRSILEPLRHNYDLVLTNFERPYWSEVVGSLLAAPLVELFYGCEVRDPLSGIYGISRDLIADYRSEIKFWFENTRGYGIDAWLVTRALRWGRKLCEVELGSRSGRVSWAKLDYVFRETAKCLFECIKYDESYWGGGASGARSFVARPDQYLARDTGTPAPGMAGAVFARQEPFSPAELVDQFKRSYHDYQKVYELSMTESILAAAVQTVSHPLESFRFEGSLWANIVYCWLLSYCFNQDLLREDLLNSLAAAFGGRVAGLMGRVQFFRTRAGDVEDINPALLIRSESLLVKLEQAKEFRRFWDDFLEFWQKKSSLGTPHLIPAFSLEFIPGKPIVLPEGIPGPSKVIKTSDTFNRIQQRSQLEFQAFLRQALQIPGDESSAVVIKRMRQFMFSLEEAVERLFPGDLNTEEGVRRVVDLLFKVLAPDRIFTIKADALREMMIRFPSQDLLIAYGFPNTQELFYSMEIRDAASLSCFMRGLRQTDQAIAWLLSDLSPDAMEETELRPLVLKARILGGFAAPGNISRLDKLAARVLVRPLAKGTGGEYPKLRFCLYIARQMGVAENFSLLWRGYARERRDLGIKLQNSLAGSYESRPFSAHNILENLHHRLLVGHLLALAERQNPALDPEDARLIRHMVDGYGLGQVLYDGAFLSCSAWTWSSYSYKGGRGLPTPLSSRVEEQWFAYELLKEIYQELGYDPGEIWKRVAQLIGEGRGGVDMIDLLIGKSGSDVSVVIQESQDYPRAKMLRRNPGNPILTAVRQHPWESKYVLNPGAIRIEDRVYLLYRAFGDDGVSRLGLAVTDGYKVLERLAEPVFAPQVAEEAKGIEDPRLIAIGDQIYMLYTAYDGVVAQIAAASIRLDDFLGRRFDRWERKGRAFEGVWDKDAVLFPERFNGRYALYHRIEPSIWLTYMDRLEFPGPAEKHAVIMGPRLGSIWDSVKIGAGTPPIKTRYGWLLIYHGVDEREVYRLGVILADLGRPERLLYRSPNPILSPETDYELGKEGVTWRRNVVFCCGAVPAGRAGASASAGQAAASGQPAGVLTGVEQRILDAGDEILVYYGAADSSIGVATAAVGDLIPEKVRREAQRAG